MRPAIPFALAALAGLLAAQDPGALTFRYRAGDVLVAVERQVVRETDPRLGFALATSHTTERRYTILAVGADGKAEALVEESSGPQQLHEYLVKGKDDREAYLKKGFEPEATVARRVLRTELGPTRFRTEPSRGEPAVFYLQEIPELIAHVLTLPADGAAAWRVTPGLPRLSCEMRFERNGEEIRGEVRLALRDAQVRGGAEVACPPGAVQWSRDPATSLPRSWRVELHYPRFPLDRPNRRIVTGELFRSTPLDAADLARLRADADAYAAVHDAFFAGTFERALQAAEEFEKERVQSRLLSAVRAEVAAFRRQVRHYGEVPPEPNIARWLGGEPTRLAGLKGKVVVLDFWATWCVPCVAGMEHLIALQDAGRADGLQVLGVTREDQRQKIAAVEAFLESGYAAAHGGRKINYPLVVLADDKTHEHFAIRAIPTLVVLDRDGKVYWEQTGSGGQARLDRILASLLGAR